MENEKKKPEMIVETAHIAVDKSYRKQLVEYLGGAGEFVLTNVIDRGHPNGPERFELTDKGIILVYNDRTNRWINILFARIGQLYSRFGDKFETLPADLKRSIKRQCEEYKRLGYNN